MIGGGISGLAAALELRRSLGADADILVLEAYDRLGGKLKTVDFADGPVDMGAEAFLTRRTGLADLVDELGLADELRVPSGLRSCFYVDGHLVSAPGRTIMGIPARGVDVADVVSPETAARIDAEATTTPLDWAVGDDINVGTLVRSRYGEDAVARLVSPMLGGVYSCSADALGLRATVPALAAVFDDLASTGAPVHLSTAVASLLAEREDAARVLAERGEEPAPLFNSFAHGYRRLVRALADAADADVRLNTQVESVGRWNGRLWLEPVGEVDAVVVATPAPTAAVLLADVAPRAAGLLEAVELASSAVVGMRFDTDAGLPETTGVLLGTDARTHAKAFTFSSRKWPHLAERGGAFVRASFGTLADASLVDADDRTLIGYAVEDLRTVTGFQARPVETFVQRWWGGLPSYPEGHLARMSAVQADLATIPRIALAGAVLQGVGVPACADSGRDAARKIIAELG
ncbi:protoporphyrinogen oxidase [Corynebacterium terpenotabidum Y-11]|uniref:Coproporphyrinogen III oxidase n=1 Tax=Corynebacterium terpenotabidum Y-11 TaxID=1200352 RepID=S4XEB0_9CORY|nr:protoporphyrinogen oxidase [Corynebacterium terpenotabidum Y-11]